MDDQKGRGEAGQQAPDARRMPTARTRANRTRQQINAPAVQAGIGRDKAP